MILTLTANPSTDRTVQLDGPLTRGAVQRAASGASQAAGKGVNVARVLVAGGRDTLAVLPSRAEDPFAAALAEEGVSHLAIPCPGEVRTNLTVAEPDGTTTKINEPGEALGDEVLEALTEAVVSQAATAPWVVISGSLPAGVRPRWYGEVIAALSATGARVALDTSGPPLVECMAGSHLPHLIKPNGEELAELAGAQQAGHLADLESDVDAAARACQSLVRSGIETVLATLGAQGALLGTKDGVWRATVPRVTPKSTVGAGDSTLAGFLLAHLDGEGPDECLRRAVAYGTAAVQLPGSTLPTPRDIHPEHVTIERVTMREETP